jgi:hypothetical protein
MENEKKFKVKMGDPFGGYITAGQNLTKVEAEKLRKEVDSECDYFTSTFIEDENGNKIYC